MERKLCSLPIKERTVYMKKRLENIVGERQVMLKLRKKWTKVHVFSNSEVIDDRFAYGVENDR